MASKFNTADLIGLLHNSDVAADEELPHRGRPVDFERRLAPCFIVGDEYGTRASTAFIMSEHSLQFTEQSYIRGGLSADLVDFEFDH